METGHEDKGCPRQTANPFGSHLDDLAGFGPSGQILVGFTLDFTGMAPDTFPGILEQIIFTHSSPPMFIKSVADITPA
jgi:hypothetical protein